MALRSFHCLLVSAGCSCVYRHGFASSAVLVSHASSSGDVAVFGGSMCLVVVGECILCCGVVGVSDFFSDFVLSAISATVALHRHALNSSRLFRSRLLCLRQFPSTSLRRMSSLFWFRHSSSLRPSISFRVVSSLFWSCHSLSLWFLMLSLMCSSSSMSAMPFQFRSRCLVVSLQSRHRWLVVSDVSSSLSVSSCHAAPWD